MTQKDWELLPAPEPWKSMQGTNYRNVSLIASAGMIIGGCFLVAAFAFTLCMSFFLGGLFLVVFLILLVINFAVSTDGKEAWEIYLGKDPRFCEALQYVLDELLVTHGYRFRRTAEPLGRNYSILTRPEIPYGFGPGPALATDDSNVVLDLAFRYRGKNTTPRLTIRLRNIQNPNYNFVMRLQKDVVNTLESLNYRSNQKSV
jgi:hypothetical protein